MKDKIISVKNHVVKHRFKYGVIIGLTAGMSLVIRNQAITNEFLKENNLYDQFYEIGIDK